MKNDKLSVLNNSQKKKKIRNRVFACFITFFISNVALAFNKNDNN